MRIELQLQHIVNILKSQINHKTEQFEVRISILNSLCLSSRSLEFLTGFKYHLEDIFVNNSIR
jgi:hypothetical protein